MCTHRGGRIPGSTAKTRGLKLWPGGQGDSRGVKGKGGGEGSVPLWTRFHKGGSRCVRKDVKGAKKSYSPGDVKKGGKFVTLRPEQGIGKGKKNRSRVNVGRAQRGLG